MNKVESLLNQLMEEAGEIIVRASKCKRFGMEEIQPGHTKSNRQRLMDEVIDFDETVNICLAEGILPFDSDEYANGLDAKRLKIEQYMDYSRELGLLND